MNFMELPDNWIVEKLGNVGEIISGGTPSTNVHEYWGGDINWITPADLSGYNEKKIHKGGKSISRLGLLKSSAKLMPPGSVIFSSRAPIGYVAIAGSELCTNQGFKSVMPHSCLFNEYLYYFLKSAKKKAEDLASGTTFKEISLTGFSKLEIPIPPIPEQHRIVAKIEELFSSLDKGIESLKTAQQQLKVYRQAVLKWAFEGRLTNENVKDGELPERWRWTNFDNVCHKIGDVDHKMPDHADKGEYPYLSTKDFTDDLKLSFHSAKFISTADFLRLSRKIRPEKGDIIFPRYGTIGKNILVETDREFLVSYSCAVIKPNIKMVDSKYLYYFSLSPLIKKEIKKYTVETTQANIGIESIKRFVLPLPERNIEQLQIVSEIETRLSVCDKIEEIITQSLQQSEALRQSILKKAFEGKLVPQDPNDPPARELLDNFREKSSNLTSSFGRKRNHGKQN